MKNRDRKTGRGSGIARWAVLGLCAAALFSIVSVRTRPDSEQPGTQTVYALPDAGGGTVGSTTVTVSRAGSVTPTRPPKNTKRAMTAAAAERLRGTGYHGTRPGSSAEDIELSAAQNTCPKCGYYTPYGSNSLCDSCRWEERYG